VDFLVIAYLGYAAGLESEDAVQQQGRARGVWDAAPDRRPGVPAGPDRVEYRVKYALKERRPRGHSKVRRSTLQRTAHGRVL